MDASHFGQQRRKDVQADGHSANQAERSAQRLLLFADSGDGFLQILENAVAQLQERFARRRDPDPSSDAMENRLAELLFQQKDLAADGRLRDVQFFASGGERARVGYRSDDLELTQIH